MTDVIRITRIQNDTILKLKSAAVSLNYFKHDTNGNRSGYWGNGSFKIGNCKKENKIRNRPVVFKYKRNFQNYSNRNNFRNDQLQGNKQNTFYRNNNNNNGNKNTNMGKKVIGNNSNFKFSGKCNRCKK